VLEGRPASAFTSVAMQDSCLHSGERSPLYCDATLCDSDRCGHWCPPDLCNVRQKPYLLHQAHRASRCTAYLLLTRTQGVIPVNPHLREQFVLANQPISHSAVPAHVFVACNRTTKSWNTTYPVPARHKIPAIDLIGLLIVAHAHSAASRVLVATLMLGHLADTAKIPVQPKSRFATRLGPLY
jgi:hypothetical protein